MIVGVDGTQQHSPQQNAAAVAGSTSAGSDGGHDGQSNTMARRATCTIASGSVDCVAAHYESGAPLANLTARMLHFPGQSKDTAANAERLGCEEMESASENTSGGSNGLIVVLDRGGCAFGPKALHAPSAGYVALVIVDSASDADETPGAITPPGLGDAHVSIPVAMVTRASGDQLRSDQAKANDSSKGASIQMTLVFELETPVTEADSAMPRRYVYEDVLAKTPLALLPGMLVGTAEANDFRKKHYTYSQELVDAVEVHAALREAEAEGELLAGNAGVEDGQGAATDARQRRRKQRTLQDVKVAVYVFYGRKSSFSITNVYLQRNLRKNGKRLKIGFAALAHTANAHAANLRRAILYPIRRTSFYRRHNRFGPLLSEHQCARGPGVYEHATSRESR
jgi:hypothetical protein